MDKKGFGQIVAALRKEMRNEFDELMTQFDLAEAARIPLVTLQKIEQGRQANLKPEIVESLADGLQLTAYSRYMFLIASLGLQDEEINQISTPPQALLEQLAATLAQLQVPALIMTCFGDLVFLNPSFLAVHNLVPNRLHASHLLTRYSYLRILLSPEFELQKRMPGDSFSIFARRVVMIYKTMTIRHRQQGFFQKILPELNRLPVFRENWQSPIFHNEQINQLTCRLPMTHPDYGSMRFLISPMPVLTNDLDLYLVTYQALDADTAQVCARLTNELGTNPLPLAPWPALRQAV